MIVRDPVPLVTTELGMMDNSTREDEAAIVGLSSSAAVAIVYSLFSVYNVISKVPEVRMLDGFLTCGSSTVIWPALGSSLLANMSETVRIYPSRLQVHPLLM